ncbi:MAG: cellulase family glycosylhydrolase [Paenibacillaceae bacterium]|jgi:hypothetical protein|nr:cellulase family glycosylhydrolase [Paenibacillaceae bacterium]
MSNEKWSKEKAKAWYEGIGPVRGFNYVTGTAVNSTEMWQADTFDLQTIDKELGWAKQAGLNQARVFLQYVVWEADREGYIHRMKQFLEIASGHGILTMFVLFDDCAFSGKQPYVGKQPEPVSGVHNSGWTPSPGFELALSSDQWSPLERYVKDIVGQFSTDPRVLVWDLYNEPGNSNLGDQTMPLVEAAFAWAREVEPDQPLTVGPWGGISEAMSSRLLELSDVLSFHYYGLPNRLNLSFILDECRRLDRPALCTECLHRQSGSTLIAVLPLFAQENIGWYVWGLVQGRTQTWLHWSSKEGFPPPAIWQHDLFHPDGTPYDAAEIDLIKSWPLASAR